MPEPLKDAKRDISRHNKAQHDLANRVALYLNGIDLAIYNNRADAALPEALSVHSISFAYHSGKIENENVTYHDTREIFEHDGVTSYTGDLRTLYEIRNAKVQLHR